MPARPALAAVVFALALASAAPPARAQTGGSPSLVDSARTAAANVWSGAQDIAIFALGLIGVDYKFNRTLGAFDIFGVRFRVTN